MVARRFRLGAVFGLATVFILGGTPFGFAEAGQGAWGTNVNQAKRPYFRPWRSTERRSAPLPRWRPQIAADDRRQVRPRVLNGLQRGTPNYGTPMPPAASPLIVIEQPRPVAETAPADMRFRPRDRRSAGRLGYTPYRGTGTGDHQQHERLHAQFRPYRSGKRVSYEQLQSRRYAGWQQAGRRAGVRSHPLAITAYAQPWPAW